MSSLIISIGIPFLSRAESLGTGVVAIGSLGQVVGGGKQKTLCVVPIELSAFWCNRICILRVWKNSRCAYGGGYCTSIVPNNKVSDDFGKIY